MKLFVDKCSCLYYDHAKNPKTYGAQQKQHTFMLEYATIEIDLEGCRSYFLASRNLHQEKTNGRDRESLLIKGKKDFEEPKSRVKGKVNLKDH